MDKDLFALLDKSITQELQMADLYRSFSYTFAEDKEFGHQLAVEEQNHAALLKSARRDFVDEGWFPPEMLSANLDALTKSNQEIQQVIKEHGRKNLSRTAAFQIALKLEALTGEVDFERAMGKQADSPALKLFQKLNRGENNHARRIRKYMRENGIDQLSLEFTSMRDVK